MSDRYIDTISTKLTGLVNLKQYPLIALIEAMIQLL